MMTRAPSLPGDASLGYLTRALAHRGPDGLGSFVEPGAALINTRLAIIDLKTGNQPFRTSDAVSVVNGEIYNDLEIRASLPGVHYHSGSDGESALHLYRERGDGFADGLRGMYGIAIYEHAKAKLVLARDPFGIKPLYYVSTPDGLAFASEAQALLSAGFASRRVDPRKRSELLQLKFTVGRETIFPGIERVLPGETIIVSGGQIASRQRRGAVPKSGPRRLDVASALPELDRLLTESVRAHIRSDVPYGLFLSGGIDSSALLVAMSRLASSPVTAFTATFPDSPAGDEGAAAARVAKAVGTDHHVVTLTKEDFWSTAPRVAAALDDPTTDAAAVPTFKLAAAARAHGIKVILSGEGADEMFGGYSRYRRATWLAGLLGRRTRTHGVFDGVPGAAAFRGWRDELAKAEAAENCRSWSSVQRLQAIDCVEWLPNDLLVKFDRCAMAHGVEGRTPFLDPVIGPFAFELPDDLKVRQGLGKWLLRKWLDDNLPAAGAFARKKGFNPPIGEWIDAYKSKLTELVLAQPGIAEMSIDDLVRETFARPLDHPQAAWSLVFYALWHSHHILGTAPDGSIADVLSKAANLG